MVTPDIVPALLELRDLNVRYGNVLAVNSVSLRVAKGGVVAIIGPNGAGKSSLLNAVAGLIPSQGSIRFDGRDIDHLDTETRTERGLVIVPETRELFGTLTVEDNLKLGGFLLRRDQSRTAKNIQFAYDLFPKLHQRKFQFAGTLSGGERQMLAVARALMSEPKLLMLDEPSLGLAPLIVKGIFDTIVQLRETEVSILLVEQNAKLALEVADYGYVMETGSTSLEGSGRDLINNPRVVETYLGLGGGAN